MRKFLLSYLLPAVCCLLGTFLATRYFFPLKTLYCGDEIIRYVFPGIDQFHYKTSEIFAALNGHPDNGQWIVFLIRILRNLLPGDTTITLMTYKILLLIFTAAVVAWFSKRQFRDSETAPLFIILGFLFAPMTWIQANEVMSETTALPLGLIWFYLSAKCLEGKKLDLKKKSLLVAQLVFWTILILLTSFQFLLQCLVIATASLVLFQIIRSLGLRQGFSASWRALGLLSLAAVLAVPLWMLTHWGIPFLEQIYFFIRPIGVAFQQWPFTALHMNLYDRYAFGFRNFFWIYFPAFLLMIPAVWMLVRKFKTFSDATQYLVVAAFAGVPLSAFAFSGNSQARYHHITNTLLLIVILYGLWLFLIDWSQRRRGKAVQIVFLLLTCSYVIFEYYPLYRTLPSLANLQAYGSYRKDGADSDEVSSLFSLVKRRQVVSFPHLRYHHYFPNKKPGVPETHLTDVIDKIKELMESQVYPLVVAPFVLNTQPTAALQYLERFGDYPPLPEEGDETQYILLAIPPGSQYESVYYAQYSDMSYHKAMDLWEESVRARPHKILYQDLTPDYSLIVAKAGFVRPLEEPQIDWGSSDSVKQWILGRIEFYDNMGWAGDCIRLILNDPGSKK